MACIHWHLQVPGLQALFSCPLWEAILGPLCRCKVLRLDEVTQQGSGIEDWHSGCQTSPGADRCAHTALVSPLCKEAVRGLTSDLL